MPSKSKIIQDLTIEPGNCSIIIENPQIGLRLSQNVADKVELEIKGLKEVRGDGNGDEEDNDDQDAGTPSGGDVKNSDEIKVDDVAERNGEGLYEIVDTIGDDEDFEATDDESEENDSSEDDDDVEDEEAGDGGEAIVGEQAEQGNVGEPNDVSDEDESESDDSDFVEEPPELPPRTDKSYVKIMTLGNSLGVIIKGAKATLSPKIQRKANSGKYILIHLRDAPYIPKKSSVVIEMQPDICELFGQDAYKAMLKGNWTKMVKIAKKKGCPYPEILNKLRTSQGKAPFKIPTRY